MSGLTIRTLDGQHANLDDTELAGFAASLRGDLVTRDSPEYDSVRRIWNAMIDRHPALFVRCRSASDVMRAVRFGRRHDLAISVRGGGHNIAGNSLVEEGMVIDLTPMRGVRVDPQHRTARAEPGVLLGEFDRDTQAFGLATPLGINSTTGLAGLTLGGGYGWLSRAFGLTADNLRSADVVTADGALLTTSEAEHPDLFWAIRGGGGNFGIVTSFEYDLHPVGPEVLAGLIVHPFKSAGHVLREYRAVMAKAPDELSAWCIMRKAPPLPFLAPEVHGTDVLVIAACFAGPLSDAERAMRPLRSIGAPHADVIGPMPYTAYQSLFDPLMAPGSRNYWKSHNFDSLSDGLIDTFVEFEGRIPVPTSEIALVHLGGAVSRRATAATAYAGRGAQFVMNVHARWDQPSDDDKCIAWARALFASTARFAGEGAYVNFMTQEEGERVRAAYGENFERLSILKARYDPTNVFRVNQNIIPTPPKVRSTVMTNAPTTGQRGVSS